MTGEDYDKIIEELKAEIAEYKHVADLHVADLKAELVKAKEALECAKLYIENITFAELTGSNKDDN